MHTYYIDTHLFGIAIINHLFFLAFA